MRLLPRCASSPVVHTIYKKIYFDVVQLSTLKGLLGKYQEVKTIYMFT